MTRRIYRVRRCYGIMRGEFHVRKDRMKRRTGFFWLVYNFLVIMFSLMEFIQLAPLELIERRERGEEEGKKKKIQKCILFFFFKFS